MKDLPTIEQFIEIEAIANYLRRPESELFQQRMRTFLDRILDIGIIKEYVEEILRYEGPINLEPLLFILRSEIRDRVAYEDLPELD